jgi:hypothetical protein
LTAQPRAIAGSSGGGDATRASGDLLLQVALALERLESRNDPHKREEHSAALRTAAFKQPPHIALFTKLLRSTRLLSQHECQLALGLEDAAEKTLKSCAAADKLAKALKPKAYHYAAERAVAIFFNHGQESALVEAFFIRLRDWVDTHQDEPSDAQMATIERDLVAAAAAARQPAAARYAGGAQAPRAHAAGAAQARATPPPKSSEPCRDFVKGSCRRSNCRFAHEKAPRV